MSWMAALRFSRHSSNVRPCPLAPGISGDQATSQSPSRSITAVNSFSMKRDRTNWKAPHPSCKNRDVAGMGTWLMSPVPKSEGPGAPECEFTSLPTAAARTAKSRRARSIRSPAACRCGLLHRTPSPCRRRRWPSRAERGNPLPEFPSAETGGKQECRCRAQRLYLCSLGDQRGPRVRSRAKNRFHELWRVRKAETRPNLSNSLQL